LINTPQKRINIAIIKAVKNICPYNVEMIIFQFFKGPKYVPKIIPVIITLNPVNVKGQCTHFIRLIKNCLWSVGFNLLLVGNTPQPINKTLPNQITANNM